MVVPGLLQMLRSLVYVQQRAVDVVLDLINGVRLFVGEPM